MGGLILEQGESEAIVGDWRAQYHRIVKGWRDCHASLSSVYLGREEAVDPWGFVYTSKRGLHLPSGRVIAYPSLHEEPRERGKGKEWWYGQGRHRARIYAGKVTENIVQALARDIIAENALEFTRRTGVHPSLLVHDEIVAVVPEAEAESMLAELQGIMRTPPKWWPEIVVWSEGDIADTYGDAK
jgi:DNA polymerase